MTNTVFNLEAIDFVIIAIYLVTVVGIGLFFGKRVKNQGEFFVASKKLPWWICSLAFMTVLISAQDIVSYSQTGYEAGFAAFQMYLDDLGWAVLFLAIGTPIYFLSGIYSVPEYMERRFNKNVRVVSSIAMLLFMLALMSFNAYAVGVLLNAMFGIDVFVGMMIITVITAVYTTSGGIMAVMITDTLQAVLIFVGGFFVVGSGLKMAGGLGNMITYLPTGHRSLFTPLFDPNFPQLGMFLGGAFAITAAWYFAHQGNIQKILAARTINQARLVTIVFMGILMPIGVLFTGMPGLILRSLVEQGIATSPENTGASFLVLVGMVATPGILGVIVAFVLSAMMSTGSTYINSSVTIFINDIYMQIKPNRSDTHYLKAARISSVIIALVVPIIYAKYFMGFSALMTALYSLTSAVMPGMVIVAVFGICSKRIHSNTATVTIAASIIGVLLAVFIPDVFQQPFCFGLYGTAGAGWFNSFVGLVWALVALVIGSLIWRKQEKEDFEYYGLVYFAQPVSKLEELYWNALAKGGKGYIDLSQEEIKEIIEAKDKHALAE
ncbi:sodium:solute symporter family protein [Sinanaerobacter chloroacetimidivorans]|uniref:Sodium/solute symporter n=1 Tax=Sinanaerobacter chloroacetimidivorans TaxID=2818044 RepID=A0A8J7W018_9FIRM|nr:sodium/solute symporter [Sinanaerobacter chloroacetimidivorans]MBR0597861.1 sodium/solute symporter [Sinanaerobacter chloroacetimidivorans]